MLNQNDTLRTENQTEDSSPIETVQAQTIPAQSFLQKFFSLFRGDKVIWTVFIILCCISLIEVYSASGGQIGALIRHGRFLVAGLLVILGLHYIPYRFFRFFLMLGLAVSFVLLLLIATRVIGVEINAGTRWISFFGLFLFQPSEIAKVTLMGTIAFLLSQQNKFDEKELFWWMSGLTIAVCGVIFFDNFSTAALLFLVCFLMMFIGNVKTTRLLKLLSVLVIAGVAFVLIVSALPAEMKQPGTLLGRYNTWVNRLVNFGGQPEVTEATFVLTQDNAARVAIANGGIFGVFPGNGTAREFLPFADSDFIYAIIIEEMGLLGGGFVMLLFIILLIRAGKIARKTEKLFPKFLVLGSALMLSTQAFLHMAVNVGVLPVTGQPLPLISLGGTSVVISSVYFGLILSVDRFGEGKKKEEVQEETTDESEAIKDDEVAFQEIKVG